MKQSEEAKTGTRTSAEASSAHDGKAIVGTAKNQIIEQVDRRSSELGEKVTLVADAVRGVGKQLRDSDRPSVAKVTDNVAERVEGIGGYLSNRGPEQLVADIKGLATREPLVFAGACFALGMFAARVVKAATHGSGESDASSSGSSRGASNGAALAGGRASSPASAGTSPSRSRSGTSRAPS